MSEIWKEIPQLPGYFASNMGRIRGRSGKILAQDKRRYMHFQTSIRSMTVHRAVLEAFRGVSELQTDHINGNPYDNRLVNLRYVTKKQNEANKINNGTRGTKLTQSQVEEIRARYKRTGKMKSNSIALAKEFGVSRRYILYLIDDVCWTKEMLKTAKELSSVTVEEIE